MSERTLGDKPIDGEYMARMNILASAIDHLFNAGNRPGDPGTGFVVMIFPFGEGGRCNYISNADRNDIITLFKEQIARFEGQPEMTGHA